MEKKSEKKNKAVCLVALKSEKILLIKKQNFWILPGGHPEEKEEDLKCLERNLTEQLPCLRLGKPVFFGGFFGKSAFDSYNLEAVAYQAEIFGEIVPGENFSSSWFDNEELEEIVLSEITHKVVTSLRRQKRL